MKKRAALYVDGFNLYHAVENLQANHLKWCNLWQLGEDIIPSKDEELVRVVFCTAFYPGDHKKRIRHERYNDALKAAGVTVLMGHWIRIPAGCNECGHVGSKPSEKETDVNLALSVFNDARLDRYDHAYLLTADSDQAATAKMLKTEFPNKNLTTVAPPGRDFSMSVMKYATSKIRLNRDHIERALFPKLVPGAKAVLRPFEYDPPVGWTPPQ